MLTRVARLPEVASVASPYATRGSAQISPSGQVAFANVTLTKQAITLHRRPGTAVRRSSAGGCRNGLQVQVEGQVAETANKPSVNSVGMGATAALIVLLIVFGSLLAAALPLITAGVALGAGTGTIGLLSHVITWPPSARSCRC